jgi:hypothetical protein
MEMIVRHPYVVSTVSGALFGAAATLTAIAGSSVAKVAADHSALASSDFSAFGGAIVGAIVGGFIAYVLQLSSLREQRKERTQIAEQTRLALAHAVAFKMLTIVNNLRHIKDHAKACQDNVITSGGNIKNPVSYLLPLLNVAPPVHFETSEMSMLMTLGDDDLFNRVIESAPIHNSIFPVWQEFTIMKAEINASATVKIDIETGIGELAFDPNGATAVKFFEANNLAQQLVDRAFQDYEEIDKTLQILMALLREKLAINFRVDDKSKKTGSEFASEPANVH